MLEYESHHYDFEFQSNFVIRLFLNLAFAIFFTESDFGVAGFCNSWDEFYGKHSVVAWKTTLYSGSDPAGKKQPFPKSLRPVSHRSGRGGRDAQIYWISYCFRGRFNSFEPHVHHDRLCGN